MVKSVRRWSAVLSAWCEQGTGPKAQCVDVNGLADRCVALGIGVGLLDRSDVPKCRRRGIAIPTHLVMPPSGAAPFSVGVCSDSETYLKDVLGPFEDYVENVAAAGEGILAFSGICPKGADDRSNAIARLKQMGDIAAKKGVFIYLEHLSTFGQGMEGHDGYLGSDLTWMAGIVREVNHPCVRLLFDFYHVVRMHGNAWLKLFQDNLDVIGHIHLAGVMTLGADIDPDNLVRDRVSLAAPGQVTDHVAIVQAIDDSGFDGTVGLEFVHSPDGDSLEETRASLRLLGMAC